VDTRRGGLHYINAGHVPPILISGKDGSYRELRDGGIVVGLFPSAEYQRGAVKLEPGDILVCTTDGIEEADNALEEEYGTERLAKCIADNRHKSAQAIIDAVLADVNAHAKGGKHIDDKVLMVVKCTDTGTLTSGTGKTPN
jgi:sigma-B regulation protein RsbU (phosphoserine phosphatase)